MYFSLDSPANHAGETPKKLANFTIVSLFTPLISPEAYLEIVAAFLPTVSSKSANI